MNQDKVLNLLHLSRKAGKLIFGFDACERSCFSGNSRLIVLAEDLSERQLKGMISLAEAYNVKWVKLGTKKIFGDAFKMRDLGILSVDDPNFTKGILKLLS
jgi:ribosomal protein L7Ae-like RNA K-turn-binding protein